MQCKFGQATFTTCHTTYLVVRWIRDLLGVLAGRVKRRIDDRVHRDVHRLRVVRWNQGIRDHRRVLVDLAHLADRVDRPEVR